MVAFYLVNAHLTACPVNEAKHARIGLEHVITLHLTSRSFAEKLHNQSIDPIPLIVLHPMRRVFQRY